MGHCHPTTTGVLPPPPTQPAGTGWCRPTWIGQLWWGTSEPGTLQGGHRALLDPGQQRKPLQGSHRAHVAGHDQRARLHGGSPASGQAPVSASWLASPDPWLAPGGWGGELRRVPLAHQRGLGQGCLELQGLGGHRD
eukprot:670860-Rhodomonas_salina.1